MTATLAAPRERCASDSYTVPAPAPAVAPQTLTRGWVYLGDGEYTTFTDLHAVAREQAHAHDDAWPLLLTVVEHGGWHELFYFGRRPGADAYESADPNGIRVGTANDRAVYPDDVEAIRSWLRSTAFRTNNLADVRRPAKVMLKAWTGPTLVDPIAQACEAAGLVVRSRGTEHVYIVTDRGTEPTAEAHNVSADLYRTHGTTYGLRWHRA
jgi:hypothetical protein